MKAQIPVRQLPTSTVNTRILRHPASTQSMRPPDASVRKICFTTRQGILVLDAGEILYCKAESNYCQIVLRSNEKFLISKTLKWVESRLPAPEYVRPHASYLVHRDCIRRIEGSRLQLTDHTYLPVSRGRHRSTVEALYVICQPSLQRCMISQHSDDRVAHFREFKIQ